VSQLPWHSQLQQTLTERKAAGLYRRTRLRDGEQGVEVVLDGRKMLSFSSNDYLGFAAHPALKKAFIESLDQEGVGSGAAHLLLVTAVIIISLKRPWQNLPANSAFYCFPPAIWPISV